MPEENNSADTNQSFSLDDPAVQAQIQSLIEKQVEERTSGLVSKRDELLAEKKKIASELRDIKSKYGDDLSRFDELLEAEKRRKEADMTLEERLESRFAEEKSQLTSMWKEQETKYKSELETQAAAIDKYLIDSALEAEISKYDGYSHMLKPALRGQLKTIKSGDDYRVVVMGANGVPQLKSDGSTMGLTDLVEKYKADEAWAPAWKASGNTGGGAVGNNSGKPASGKLTKSSMTVEEKVAFISENGQAQYEALPY